VEDPSGRACPDPRETLYDKNDEATRKERRLSFLAASASPTHSTTRAAHLAYTERRIGLSPVDRQAASVPTGSARLPRREAETITHRHGGENREGGPPLNEATRRFYLRNFSARPE